MTTTPEGNSASFIIPKPVFWGLLVPGLTFLVAAVWAWAVLTNTVATMAADRLRNHIETQARLSAVESRVEVNKDAGASVTNSIDLRLTRMEAQLSYLVGTTGAGKK